jgi:hypothetical protein
MSRTQARLDSDLPYQDGHIFVPVIPSNITTGAGAVANSPGTGLYATSLPTAATAYVATIPLGAFLFRTGVEDDLQEQFGSLISGGAQGAPVPGQVTYQIGSVVAGSNVNVNVISSGNYSVGQTVIYDTVASGVQEFPVISAIPDGTHITFATVKNSHSANAPISGNQFTTPAGITGRPPFTGTSQLTPVTSPRPKGILFKSIYPVYTIGSVNATLNTIGLTQATFANGAAVPTATNIIASAANGLGTTFGATMNVTPIPVPSAGQIFRTSKFTEYVLQWALTTGAASGTALLYGVFLDVTYNFA